ncbi:TPA: CRISPR-associated protein Cmr4 [Streptococcus suis]|nr:CRISPR-associated protein Cmr4 [Streptococcus suis]
MKANIYLLECLTNLHVGNGEVNYNIVDNEVERDAVTGYPTINSSGVKGALRAHFEELGHSKVKEIFGEDQPGKLKFLSANLLALSVQESTGNKPYSLKQPKTAEELFDSHQNDFGVKAAIPTSYSIQPMSDQDFDYQELPVIARNHLVNGISKNLWYEEVVPHRSLFYITVLAADGDSNLLDEFDKVVNGQIVQFGANASIGYGLCKLTRLNEEDCHE